MKQLPEPIATHEHQSGGLPQTLEFLKRTRNELRTLRKVHVYPHRLEMFDVNNDRFVVENLGYKTADICAVLDAINTNYKRESIGNEIAGEYKEFKTGRRYAWAADRVM